MTFRLFREDLEPGDHARAFRASVPIRVSAYCVLLSSAVFFPILGIFEIHVQPILWVTLGETAVLACVYRWAVRSPHVAFGYFLIEILAQTVIFWFLGPLRVVVALVVYIFQLMNTGIRLTRTGYFVSANIFVGFYAAMVILENTGMISTYPSNNIQFTQFQRYATILIANVSMNTAAWFVSSFDHFLEQKAVALAAAKRKVQEHSKFLERKVEERTKELKDLNRALDVKNKELLDLQRQTDEFIRAVGHDLKSPLSAICNLIPFYEKARHEGNEAEAGDWLKMIRENADRGYEMAVALQEAFRRAASPEPISQVDLKAALRSLEPELLPHIEARGIELRVAGDLPAVVGHREKLTHVLRNLLTNAIKYASSSAAPRIEVGVAPSDGGVLLFVRDNGPGIAPEHHERIFKMFHRLTDKSTGAPEGKGVGLAVVKMIVEQHGGKVWVESAPGAGATFWVRLPRAG